MQGVYELGSTFKIFAVAQAMQLGLVNPATMVPTKSPMVWGRFRIRDFHNYGAENSVTDIIVKSSNVGTARIVQMIGADRQRDFLRKMGFLEPTSVELVEAIAEPARDILETIHMVLERTPPELVSDVAQNGIVMAGGGSLIYGFDQLVEKDTGIRTTVVDDALSCAAFGSGKMLMNLNDMPEGMVNLARKRQMKA